jgi:cell fate regulator YaaT (PSP1 superfamily)
MDLDALKKEYEYMNEMIEQYPKLKTISDVREKVRDTQKQLVFHEPWLLQGWEMEEKKKFLAQYTEEERKHMTARVKLEARFRKGEFENA